MERALAQGFLGNGNDSRARVASALEFSQWNFTERTHMLGRANLLMAMNFDYEANSIIFVNPMVYLTVPVKMRKGTSVWPRMLLY